MNTSFEWRLNLCRGLLLSLIGLNLVWELFWAPTGQGTWTFKVLPLVWSSVGVWQGRKKSLQWLSLLVWLYIGEAAVRATSGPTAEHLPALLSGLVGLALFASCAWAIKSHRDFHPPVKA